MQNILNDIAGFSMENSAFRNQELISVNVVL